MTFKVKKGLSLSQRRKRDSIRQSRPTPKWIIVTGATALLGYAAIQMHRMGVFESAVKIIASLR